MAIAYASTLSLLILPYLAYAYATIQLPLRTVLAALKAPMLSSLAMAVTVWLMRPPVGPYWHPLLRLGLSCALGATVYMGLMLLFARPFLHNVVISTVTAMFPVAKRFLPDWSEDATRVVLAPDVSAASSETPAKAVA
jgi:hypothetical protein